jgi:uncharacterized membrane protein HdeD (DUF308 family)
MTPTKITSARERSRQPAGKLILLGALMVILGVLFMVVPKAMGRGSAMYLGLLLTATGLIETISGRRGQPEQHRGLLVGGGTLWLVVGLIVLFRPAAAMGVISLLFVVLLLGGGLQAVWVSLADRYAGWQWDCLFGVAALIFGIAIAGMWPSVALWLPGSLIGMAVIIRGATILVGGLEQGGRPRSMQQA